MEFIGTLFSIGEIETSEGALSFTKRPFFAKYVDTKNNEQLVKFVLYNPNLYIIDNFEINQTIKINFDFKGFISNKSGKFFEEKIASDIKAVKQNIDNIKNKTKNIPLIGKVQPDYSKKFEQFPEELIY